jgi:hypothetical protein
MGTSVCHVIQFWDVLLRSSSGVEARGGLDSGSGDGVQGRGGGGIALASSISVDLEKMIDQNIIEHRRQSCTLCNVHHRRMPDLGDDGVCGFFYKL